MRLQQQKPAYCATKLDQLALVYKAEKVQRSTEKGELKKTKNLNYFKTLQFEKSQHEQISRYEILDCGFAINVNKVRFTKTHFDTFIYLTN